MSEVSMSVALGAWFAAVAGGATGLFDVFLRRDARASALANAFAGAAIAALSYGAFVVAGAAVSLLTFSSSSDGWPALICVVIGCAVFLAVRGLHAAIAPRFGMPARRRASQPRTVTDLIDARPRGGSPTMWLGGVGLALLPLIYGIGCIVTRRGELGTVIWPSEVQGGAAIALGFGWIGVALFLHFHFFFGLHVRLASFSRRGKSVALVMAAAGLSLAGAWSVFAQIPQ
jgi:hypothetical protein